MRPRCRQILATAALAVSLTAIAHEGEPPTGNPDRVGDVRFPVSCNAPAQQSFNRAVAVLHSFFYQAATQAFARTIELDPNCAMGYWGIAMSQWYPLWFPPGKAALEKGAAAVDAAKRIDAPTPREQAFIAAIDTFYRDASQRDHRTRVLAYEQAMAALHADYPDDREAAAFYALALQAAADPDDRSYARQLRSGTILERLFAVQPNHPGVAHYLIHAYDYPGLAEHALGAARVYAHIAPDVPHALHMPSHTFTYLGMWRESIDANLAAAAAARTTHWTAEELHAMDYLVYAHLQGGDAAAARTILDDMEALQVDEAERTLVTDYARAAAPARFALEQHRWRDTAKLTARPSRFPATEAITHFARALGAAQRRDTETARHEIDELVRLRDALIAGKQTYWAKQVEVQRITAGAWRAWAEGDRAGARQRMAEAVRLEDSTYKHPVTPAPIVPAHESFGDLLLLLDEPGTALAQYELALQAFPNRRNALLGAARAARLVSDAGKAEHYEMRASAQSTPVRADSD